MPNDIEALHQQLLSMQRQKPAQKESPDVGALWEQLKGMQEPPGKIEAMGAGLWQGLKESAQGLEQIATRMPTILPGAAAGQQRMQADIDRRIQQGQAAYQANPAVKQHPLMAGAGRIGGNIAATAPMMMMPGGAGGAAARTGAGLLARGAATGAAGAAMQPAMGQDYWTEKSKQMAIGAAVGAALPAAGSVLSPRLPNPSVVAQGVSRAFRPFYNFFTGAEERTNEGFARTIARQALDPIGASREIEGRISGHALVDKTEQTISNAYNQVLPYLSLQEAGIPPPSSALANFISSMSDDHIRRFNSTIDGYLTKKFTNGIMDGETFKRAQSELTGRAAGWIGKNDDELGRAVLSRLKEINSALEQQNPQFAGKLSRINESWMMYARMRAASSGATSSGNFSPADYLRAIRRKDQSVDHGTISKGDAPLQGFAEAAHAAMGPRTMNLLDLMHIFTHRGLPMQATEAIAGPVGRAAKAATPIVAPSAGAISAAVGEEPKRREPYVSPTGL